MKVIEVAMGPVHTLCLTEESVQDQEGFQKKEKSDRRKTAKDVFSLEKPVILAKKNQTFQPVLTRG